MRVSPSPIQLWAARSMRSRGASDESDRPFGSLDLRTKGSSGFGLEGPDHRDLDVTPCLWRPPSPIKPSMGRRLVRLQCPANMGSRCCGRLTVGPGTATHPESMDSCRCLLCDPGSCECPLRRVLESLSMGLSLEHCRRCRNRAPFRLENRPDQRPAFSHIITAFRAATFSHIPTLSGQCSLTSRSARAVIGVVILCLGSGEPFSRIPRRAAQRPPRAQPLHAARPNGP